MKNKKYKIFIGAFLFLYVIVAFISFMHSIEFFNVGNVRWMSILLGCAYELGQAVVLASILLSDNKRSLLTWFLFIVLTFVQIIGNVFSVYKYISMSEVEYYKYIQGPLLFWIQGVDEQMVKVIISWITGALLPIVALGMTGMVASNIQIINTSNDINSNDEEDFQKEDVKEIEKPIEEHIEEKQKPIIETKVEEPQPIIKEELNKKQPIDNTSKNDKPFFENIKQKTKNLHFKRKEKK